MMSLATLGCPAMLHNVIASRTPTRQHPGTSTRASEDNQRSLLRDLRMAPPNTCLSARNKEEMMASGPPVTYYKITIDDGTISRCSSLAELSAKLTVSHPGAVNQILIATP